MYWEIREKGKPDLWVKNSQEILTSQDNQDVPNDCMDKNCFPGDL